MDTTLISASRARQSTTQSPAALRRTAAVVLGRVRMAIVNGPSGACWQPGDAATSFPMLPTRERARLLDRGLASSSN